MSMRGPQFVIVLIAAATFACSERSSGIDPTATTTPSKLDGLIADSNLNRDWQTRDKILGIAVRWGKDDSGGIFRVERLELGVLQQLLSNNFIDSADQQNEAPTVAQIIEFLSRHPGTYAFGYAVSPDRPDYRVSLEGIVAPKSIVTPDLRAAVDIFCQDADETGEDPDVFCWWD